MQSPKVIVRVEQLESRCVLSVQSYTQTVTVILADQSTTSVTKTFNWDLTDSNYANILSGLGNLSFYNQSIGSAVGMAVSDAGSGDPYGLECNNVTNAIDTYWAQAASTMPSLLGLTNGINDSYTDPSSGVTIDSSVVDNATAAARVKALYGNLQTIQTRTQQILDDINSSGTLGQCAKSIYYYAEVKSLSNQVKTIGAELKLIKDAWPGAFR